MSMTRARDRRLAPSAASPEGDQPPVLELRGASAYVAGRRLWHGLDLSVGAGEFVAVLGPNGAGKSTLIKMILGLLPSGDGEIRVLGQQPGRGRTAIGYLPQRRTFEAGVRIRGIDLVRLGWDGHRWGIPLGALLRTPAARATHQRVAEAVGLVGAAAYARRPIGELSGGEQQRLLIAQALVRRPRLLLLDEPLDSLDLPNQQAVAALIGRIAHRENVTVLMVAHDVNPIVPYLDRVLYLTPGGTASGDVEDVITSETLTALYGTRVEVLRSSDGRLVVVGQSDTVGEHAAVGAMPASGHAGPHEPDRDVL